MVGTTSQESDFAQNVQQRFISFLFVSKRPFLSKKFVPFCSFSSLLNLCKCIHYAKTSVQDLIIEAIDKDL